MPTSRHSKPQRFNAAPAQQKGSWTACALGYSSRNITYVQTVVRARPGLAHARAVSGYELGCMGVAGTAEVGQAQAEIHIPVK